MRFLLSSVFLPEGEGVAAALTLPSKVEGLIVSFSDSGACANAFAVVEVIRRITVVVPADSLELIEAWPGGDGFRSVAPAKDEF